MHHVDVRVMNPAIPCKTTESVTKLQWELLQLASGFTLLCVLWGAILFIAVTSALR